MCKFSVGTISLQRTGFKSLIKTQWKSKIHLTCFGKQAPKAGSSQPTWFSGRATRRNQDTPGFLPLPPLLCSQQNSRRGAPLCSWAVQGHQDFFLADSACTYVLRLVPGSIQPQAGKRERPSAPGFTVHFI